MGQFKALLAQAALCAQARGTQGGFVDQLQGQAWFDVVCRPAGPLSEQVPSSEAEVFGDEQPEADEIPGDFIGEELSNAAFQT